jgi:putative flippase GtrA
MNDRSRGRFLSEDARQFLRFAVVGCVNVAVSFAVFLVCFEVWPLGSLALDLLGPAGEAIRTIMANHGVESVDAAVANAVGYGAGMMNSFVLNKLWTFRARGRTLQQMQRFVILNVLGLLLSTALLFVMVDVLGGPHLPIWALATGIVMVLNYFGNKLWAFTQTHNPDACR